MNEESIRLLAEAERLLEADPAAQQAVAALGAKGELHAFAVRDWADPAFEEAFLRELRESGDTALELLACVWQEGRCPDLPSIRLRRALLTLDAGNADARLILNGAPGGGRELRLRRLADSLPG